MKIRQLLETNTFGTNTIILSKMKLTSLPDGIPEKITGNFNCSGNELTSLEGAPETIGAGFWCDHNKLTSLEDMSTKSIGGGFWCNNNKLTSLRGCLRQLAAV